MHLMGPKMWSYPPFSLHHVSNFGFFHVDCPTLCKINRAVFCQWSLLNSHGVFFVCSNLSGRKVNKKYICRTRDESFLTPCLKCKRAAFVLLSFLYPLSIYLINYGLLAFAVSGFVHIITYSVQIVYSFAIQLKLKALGTCFLKRGIYFLCKS